MSKDGFIFSSKQIDVNKKITIVASKWNAALVDKLLESGKAHLEELGFTNIKIVNVPGAWELVHAAQRELADADGVIAYGVVISCLLYTSPSPRDMRRSRMPSSA